MVTARAPFVTHCGDAASILLKDGSDLESDSLAAPSGDRVPDPKSGANDRDDERDIVARSCEQDRRRSGCRRHRADYSLDKIMTARNASASVIPRVSCR